MFRPKSELFFIFDPLFYFMSRLNQNNPVFSIMKKVPETQTEQSAALDFQVKIFNISK